MLITGGTGFIGHFLVNEFINDFKIVCIVKPETKNLIRLYDIKKSIEIVEHDIRNPLDKNFFRDVKVILHAGGNPSSESSIKDPLSVVLDNVVGTVNMLELARGLNLDRFVYYGAAESFGPIAPGTDSYENDAYNSVSPYAASKAGGEELCVAYSKSFNLPVSIIHIANTFGQMSQSNRLPVVAIKNILNNKPITFYVDSEGSYGGRRWFHAEDVAHHTRFILNHQRILCEKWNSAGPNFINNFDFVKIISKLLNKDFSFDVKKIDRAGHDTYFSISPEKLYRCGWKPSFSLEQRLQQTIDWYKKNPEWLERS